VIVKRYI